MTTSETPTRYQAVWANRILGTARVVFGTKTVKIYSTMAKAQAAAEEFNFVMDLAARRGAAGYNFPGSGYAS